MDNDQEDAQDLLEDDSSYELNADDLDSVDSSDEDLLLYTTRLRKAIKLVADQEKFEDILLGKEGLKRIQDSIRYVTLQLTFEMVEVLREKNKKTIKPWVVDMALTRILVGSDRLNYTISELEKLVRVLEQVHRQTSQSKAFDLINIGSVQLNRGVDE